MTLVLLGQIPCTRTISTGSNLLAFPGQEYHGGWLGNLAHRSSLLYSQRISLKQPTYHAQDGSPPDTTTMVVLAFQSEWTILPATSLLSGLFASTTSSSLVLLLFWMALAQRQLPCLFLDLSPFFRSACNPVSTRSATFLAVFINLTAAFKTTSSSVILFSNSSFIAALSRR